MISNMQSRRWVKSIESQSFFPVCILVFGLFSWMAGPALAADPPLTNLTLWLRADAGVNGGAAVDGAGVSSWANQVAGWSNATQATAGLQPVYHTDVINGHPAIRFNPGPTDASNDDLLTLPTFDFPATVSVYAVIKREENDQAGTGRDRVFAGLNPGSMQFAAFNSDDFPGVIGVHLGHQGQDSRSTSFPVDDEWQILGARYDGSTVNFSLWSLDGVLLNSQASAYPKGDFANSEYSIGGFATGTGSLDGDVGALLVYNTQLTLAQESAVVSHLAGAFAVPEPSSIVLVCCGLVAMVGYCWRSRAKAVSAA